MKQLQKLDHANVLRLHEVGAAGGFMAAPAVYRQFQGLELLEFRVWGFEGLRAF